MQWNDVYDLAQKSIRSNKLRARITVAIIALGITALVGIITAIKGIESTIYSSFSGMGTNTFTLVEGQMGNTSKEEKGGKRKLHLDENAKKINYDQALDFIKNYTFPAQTAINILCSNSAIVKCANKKSNPNIWVKGIDASYTSIVDLTIDNGRNFSTIEFQNGADVCLVGNALAEKYISKKVNNAVNNIISVNEHKYRVVGVLKTKGSSMVDRTDNTILVPINNARKTFDLSKNSYVLSVKVNDVKKINIASSEAEGTMRSVRKTPINAETDFDIYKNDTLVKKLLGNIQYVSLAATFIAFITLLGAAIGLMNIMLVAVAERTKEIGLSKAIGAQSQTIKRQFLAESIIVSIKGGLWGIAFGIAIGNGVAMLVHSPFIVPWLWILFALIICIVVGIASGIYPAIKASKLNPIEALRYE